MRLDAVIETSFSDCMGSIRILLCHHLPIVRSGLRLLIERERGMRVVAEASGGPEAIALAEYLRPNIALLDVSLPGSAGILAAREISSKQDSAGIIFVCEHIEKEYIAEAFKAGARGYVVADSAQTDLVQAIRVVADGGRFLRLRDNIRTAQQLT